MSPVQTSKSAPAQKQSQSQLKSSLQSRGMSTESMMGREDINSLVGEPGKGASDKTQAFARSSARGFFQRKGAFAAKAGAERKDAPAAPKGLKK
jgi:hypothetical protein